MMKLEGLRQVRQERGLSLNQLGAAASLNKSTLWGMEHGRHDPRLSSLLAVARALGVGVDDLVRSSARRRRRGGAALVAKLEREEE